MRDPKPPKRIVDPQAGVAKVRREGHCRVCGKRDLGMNRMHIIRRSQGGDDVDDNIAPGCGSGVAGCHGVLTHQNKDGETGLVFEEASRLFTASLLHEEREYVRGKKGEAWYERVYGWPLDYKG